MAKTGGAREGAGRKAGTLNRRSVEVLAGSVSQGVSPIEYMLKILRDDNADPKERAWAAEKAAPFVHPRPAPIPRLVALALPATDTAEGVKLAIAAVVKAVASGTIAPSEAQSIVAVIEAQRKAIETDDVLTRLEALEQRHAR